MAKRLLTDGVRLAMLFQLRSTAPRLIRRRHSRLLQRYRASTPPRSRSSCSLRIRRCRTWNSLAQRPGILLHTLQRSNSVARSAAHRLDPRRGPYGRRTRSAACRVKQTGDRAKAQTGGPTNIGEWRCAAPLELSYATSSDGNSDGKITSPVLISLIDLESAGNTKSDPKQALHFGQCQT
jgi:hypothetical protein